MKSPRRNAAGFSLVELLIASIVVAAGGTLLAGGLVTSNRSAALRLRQLIATQLLASQVALLGDEVVGDAGETGGTYVPPLEAFHWTQRWELVADQLARTTVSVSDGSYTAHAVTYLPIKEP
jgi:type II secretory pathway pseudopilin PulG